MSSKGLIDGSLAAFSRDVVTLGHTRKFARKARDYMRAYRAGAKGLERVVRTARMPAGATRARVARAATTVVAAARMVNPRLREWMRAMTVRTGERTVA